MKDSPRWRGYWKVLLCVLALAPQIRSTEATFAHSIPAPVQGGVANPDGILSPQQEQLLVDHLQSLDLFLPVSADKSVEVQVAVAVVERIPMMAYPHMEEDEAAQRMARELHDAWGVGNEIKLETTSRTNPKSTSTGVVVFLSVYDRVVSISRGGALDRILTDARLDSIILSLGPLMRQAKYAEGLVLAVEEVAAHVRKGEPSWTESLLNLFQPHNLFLLVWFGLLFNGLWSARRLRREQIAYVQAASHLSEIDRAQAEALQGQYQATSCPICLEDFESKTVGSDGQPIKLLRCGHVFDETCWSEWVTSGRGNVTKCPICKMDVGDQPPIPRSRSSHPTTTAESNTAPATAATAAVSAVAAVAAVVDEATVGNASEEEDIRTAAEPPTEPNGSLAPNRTDTEDSSPTTTVDHNDDNDDGEARAIRRFRLERNFRLMRLGHRFPNFVTQAQVQRWSSPTYQGSLVRDPAFQQREPQVMRRAAMQESHRLNRMGSSRPSMSFGGGRSSGGRAGRF